MKKLCLCLDGDFAIKEVNDWALKMANRFGTFFGRWCSHVKYIKNDL